MVTMSTSFLVTLSACPIVAFIHVIVLQVLIAHLAEAVLMLLVVSLFFGLEVCVTELVMALFFVVFVDGELFTLTALEKVTLHLICISIK